MKMKTVLVAGLALAVSLVMMNAQNLCPQGPGNGSCPGQECPGYGAGLKKGAAGKECPGGGAGMGQQKRIGQGQGKGMGKGFRGGARDGTGPKRDGSGGNGPKSES